MLFAHSRAVLAIIVANEDGLLSITNDILRVMSSICRTGESEGSLVNAIRVFVDWIMKKRQELLETISDLP